MPRKVRLLTPGPTMIPERVQHAMSMPILHHRSPEFKPIFSEAQRRLKTLYQTNDDVMMLASSGTGAMESAVVNLFSPGDKLIVVDAGKFGQRWTNLCKAYNITALVIAVEWGQAVTLDQIQRVFKDNPDAKGLAMQACETSTGVMHPVEAIASWKKKNAPNLLYIVDGITAVGSVNVPMDAWEIDALICGSQKALMLPPGLATIGLSTKAWLRAEQNKGTPKFYFDLNREKKNQVGQTTTAWTPAITLITGLVESLKMLEEEGYPNVFARHLKLARATQLAGRAIGLNLLATENPSPTITALNIPDGLDGEKVVKTMRDVHGFTVAGGQDHLKGKIVRIGHMGYIDEYDLMATFLALERALVANGWKFPSGKTWGASVSAFVASLQESP